jgi:hypothetical protein
MRDRADLIWFGGLVYKSFQGPLVWRPPFYPKTLGVLLAILMIEPVSNPFLYSMWALEKYKAIDCTEVCATELWMTTLRKIT